MAGQSQAAQQIVREHVFVQHLEQEILLARIELEHLLPRGRAFKVIYDLRLLDLDSLGYLQERIDAPADQLIGVDVVEAGFDPVESYLFGGDGRGLLEHVAVGQLDVDGLVFALAEDRLEGGLVRAELGELDGGLAAHLVAGQILVVGRQTQLGLFAHRRFQRQLEVRFVVWSAIHQ
jgi:hypothetical protein